MREWPWIAASVPRQQKCEDSLASPARTYCWCDHSTFSPKPGAENVCLRNVQKFNSKNALGPREAGRGKEAGGEGLFLWK